jgi:hypothetical protein
MGIYHTICPIGQIILSANFGFDEAEEGNSYPRMNTDGADLGMIRF